MEELYLLVLLNNNMNKPNISFSRKKIPYEPFIKKVSTPIYGIDYKKGDIGFVRRIKTRTIIDLGIEYFTRKQRQKTNGLIGSHAIIVKDASTCIEAVRTKGGVIETNLNCYLKYGNFEVIFRTPKDMTEEMADEIVRNAEKEEGKKYAINLILLNVLRNSLLGHLVDKGTNYKSFDNLSSLFHSNKRAFICSELVSNCLQKVDKWAYHNKDILTRKSSGITPQELLDSKIFEDLTIVCSPKATEHFKY